MDYGTLTIYMQVHYVNPQDKMMHWSKVITLAKFHNLTADDAKMKVREWKAANNKAELIAEFRMRVDD